MKRKNIVITGASSGLGKGMAIAFAKRGANLGLCARRAENLIDLKNEILEINPSAKVIIKPLDVNVHSEVFACMDDFASELGQLDRVIVNAGIGIGGTIGKGHFDENKQTIETNVIAAMAQCEAAMKIFRAQDSGHLVTISSASAVRGFGRSMNAYAASKAALSALSEGMYLDMIGKPINVTCIHPGFIHTDLNKDYPTMPFAVDLEAGVKSIIKAIEKEKQISYCPSRWAFIARLMKFIPTGLLRRLL